MKPNPIEFEVFKNLFLSIAEEMGVTLCRTGFSPNIKERLDYSCAVYDANGDTIAQGDHMPVHLGAMPLSVRAAIDAVDMEPGDIVMLNDPFKGGTHLPDITLVSPVFLDSIAGSKDPASIRNRRPGLQSSLRRPGLESSLRRQGLQTRQKPAFFVANRAHHSDVGGMSPGSMPVASEIYQEGLIIPPVRLARRGRIVDDIMALLLNNVRTPDEREGDIAAQIAANRVAETRLRDVVARYGRAQTMRYAGALQDYTERVVQHAIKGIPDGDYVFEDALDDDGFSNDPVTIKVRVSIRKSRATVDFTGSAPQVTGSVNANYAITLSACLYAFRCLVQDDVLYNAGVGRPITVIAPEGSIVNALRPSAVAGGNVETSQRLVDVIFGALGVVAASQGTMNNVLFGGANFGFYETLGGGAGAGPDADGASVIHVHMSNTRLTDPEVLETRYPVRL
ncbi:MAG TPA: hydantoinase B/oxoprolinase family protein, partial [Vicinamibacterales bacterium]|nr:hydantoinase B/oxoprolinase family protein [Vicinamibacterales bacterium]